MIAAWQKARNQTPATGYLTGNQHQALLREAAPALQKYDDEQKKTEEAKKKAEEEAKKKAEEDAKKKLEDEAKQKAVAAASPAPAPSPAATAPGTPAPSGAAGPIPNGPYSGGLNVNYRGYNDIMQVALTMTNGTGSGTVTHPRCGTMPISLKVDPSGTVTGDVRFAVTADCGNDGGKLTGRVDGTRMVLTTASTTTSARGQLTLTPGVSAPVAVVPMASPAAPPPPTAAPRPAEPAAAPGTPAGPFDGAYNGPVNLAGMFGGGGSMRLASLRVTNGSGSGTVTSPGCGTGPITIAVSAAGDVSGTATFFGAGCERFPFDVRGRAEGGQLRLTFRGVNGSGSSTMTRQ